MSVGGVTLFSWYISYRIIAIIATTIAAMTEVFVIIWRTKHKTKKKKKKKANKNLNGPQQYTLPSGPNYLKGMALVHESQSASKALPPDSRIEVKLPPKKKPVKRK